MGPRLAAGLGAMALGCASVNMEPIDAPQGALVLGLMVEGPEHTLDKEQRCRGVGQRLGAQVVDADHAPVTVYLHLEDDKNRLALVSRARGSVLREPRASWSMEELCVDAFRRAAVQLLVEQRSRVAHAVVETPVASTADPGLAQMAPQPAPGAALQPVPAGEAPESAGASSNPVAPGITQETPTRVHASRKRLLSVTTEPPGATLWIDGNRRGQAPLHREPVGAGDHVVEAQWPDGRWMVLGARLRRGSQRTLSLRALR